MPYLPYISLVSVRKLLKVKLRGTGIESFISVSLINACKNSKTRTQNITIQVRLNEIICTFSIGDIY